MLSKPITVRKPRGQRRFDSWKFWKSTEITFDLVFCDGWRIWTRGKTIHQWTVRGVYIGLLQSSMSTVVGNTTIHIVHGIGNDCDAKYAYRSHGRHIWQSEKHGRGSNHHWSSSFHGCLWGIIDHQTKKRHWVSDPLLAFVSYVILVERESENSYTFWLPKIVNIFGRNQIGKEKSMSLKRMSRKQSRTLKRMSRKPLKRTSKKSSMITSKRQRILYKNALTKWNQSFKRHKMNKKRG